jgi:hypothetical protein
MPFDALTHLWAGGEKYEVILVDAQTLFFCSNDLISNVLAHV